MLYSSLRPLVLLVAGAGVGALITFGLLNRHPSVQENANQISLIQSDVPPKTLRVPLENAQKANDPSNTPVTNAPSDETDEADNVPSLETQAMLKAAQRVPMKPIPKPTITFQANGLPVGVSPDAVNMDVYKRLPGVQPPLINLDGRDLGPEALQMIQDQTEEKPFPGGIPSASATPMPFPQTVEEANRQGQSYQSPSPAQ
ncbi:MAG TPA: hypothetical protein VIH58_06915 [Chthoniobacterales bacterium]|jgi:hypothetical protein